MTNNFLFRNYDNSFRRNWPHWVYRLPLEVQHIACVNELFRDSDTSPAFLYTRGMMIGFRNVDSQEMDGSPLFEVLPASQQVERALLDDRVKIQFALKDDGQLEIASVESQRDNYAFSPSDFRLRLKTVTVDRYWLDTGVLETPYRSHDDEGDEA